MCLVSVIMPVYDGVVESELRAASDSIRQQTWTDFEFLIYTDGMRNEQLLGLLWQMASDDPRIRIITGAENRGVSFALNRLVEEARGAYVARMDADDISHSRRLAEQVAFLQSHPEVSLVGTFAEEIDHAGQVMYRKEMPVNVDEVRRFMSRRDPFIHPTVMFRREFFEKLGAYCDEPRCRALEDTELWSRALLANCQAVNLPEFLFSFRVNPSFYGRRRGWKYAFNELRLRANYVWRAGLPLYYLVFPPLVALVRISPGFLTRILYKRARG